MRTESSTSSASAAKRLRDEMARARRWVRRRGRATQVALIAVAAAGLAGMLYFAVPLDREGRTWLYDGRKFSRDSAQAIGEALAAEKVAFVTDQSNRVGVALTRWSDALAAIKKHGVEPSSLEEVDKDGDGFSLLSDTPTHKAERDHRRLERQFKAIIEGYEGIRSAYVSILRTPGRGYRAVPTVSVLVVLDIERKPPHHVIQSIQTVLSAGVKDLSRDAISVCDKSGVFYLEAGNPKAASATQSLARAEQLRDGLLQNLSPLIPGIDVVVQVEPAATAEPSPSQAAAAPPIAPPPPIVQAPSELKPNEPMQLDAEPSALPAVPPPPPGAGGIGKAKAWVKVPRSYYHQIFRENTPNRQPSAEDLAHYDGKTRELINNAWSTLVPQAEQGSLRVNMILDDLGAGGTLVVPGSSADGQRAWPEWAAPVALGAGVGLGVALVLVIGFGMMAARRPVAARPSRTTVRSGVVVDGPSGPVPGPSERVRDLVRRDPEAAAGVLQRWIGQGEGGPIG